MTDLVLENTVKLRCTSNTGVGTWFVYKGPIHDVMFQDKALGSAYNQSKFKMAYISSETIEIAIRSFHKNDIDVYMCSHKDKSSKNLDMRTMKVYERKCILCFDCVYLNLLQLYIAIRNNLC